MDEMTYWRKAGTSSIVLGLAVIISAIVNSMTATWGELIAGMSFVDAYLMPFGILYVIGFIAVLVFSWMFSMIKESLATYFLVPVFGYGMGVVVHNLLIFENVSIRTNLFDFVIIPVLWGTVFVAFAAFITYGVEKLIKK